MEEAKVNFYRSKLLATIGEHKASNVNLKKLHEAITNQTKQRIGFNTLRRFYGLLPSTSIRLNTWKIFDQYLSIASKTQNNHRWFFHHWTPYHLTLQKFQEGDILGLKEHLKNLNDHKELAILLGMTTTMLLAQHKIEEVFLLFEDYDVFNDELGGNFAEIVMTFLRTTDEKTRTASYLLTKSKSYKENVIYKYIDYSHLNGFYYELLKHCQANDDGEELFLNCMFGYRSYLNNGEISDLKEYSIPQLLQFYPVLSGRYVGYLICQSPEKAQKISETLLFPLLEKAQPHYVLLELIPALIWTKNLTLLEQLFETYYEALYEMDHWHAYTTMNVYLSAEVILSIYLKDFKRAKIAFDAMRMDLAPHSYKDYIMILRLIGKYHLSKNPLSKLDSRNTLKEYETLISKLGFYRLNKSFLLHYFDNS